jgi:hypothetical protein
MYNNFNKTCIYIYLLNYSNQLVYFYFFRNVQFFIVWTLLYHWYLNFNKWNIFPLNKHDIDIKKKKKKKKINFITCINMIKMDILHL